MPCVATFRHSSPAFVAAHSCRSSSAVSLRVPRPKESRVDRGACVLTAAAAAAAERLQSGLALHVDGGALRGLSTTAPSAGDTSSLGANLAFEMELPSDNSPPPGLLLIQMFGPLFAYSAHSSYVSHRTHRLRVGRRQKWLDGGRELASG